VLPLNSQAVGRHGNHLRLLRLLPLTATFTIVSCVPLPHRAFRTPVISGTLAAVDGPVARAKVRVVADPDAGACDGPHVFESTTREDGAFSLCPIPDFQLFLHVMAHRRFRWNVCAQSGAGWLLLHRGEQYTLVDSGPRLLSRLSCQLQTATCIETADTDVSTDKALRALAPQRCKGIGP
jgi:hypothetical protein